MKTKILYVEDDESIAFLTKDGLEMQGYTVMHMARGEGVINLFQSQAFDLCILDVMLPGIDGFTLAKEIRQLSALTPIIFLSAKSTLDDKIEGLEIGADDYMTKPFSIKELTLRIDAILRRTIQTQKCTSPVDDIQFSNDDYSVIVGTKNFALTARECELFRLFFENMEVTLKRSDILLKIWGSDDFFLGRSLDVFISRLRKMLKHSNSIEIENIHGVGFCMKRR